MQKHLEISDNGLKLTTDSEALRLVPYNDERGFATVGWGHLIRRGPVQASDQPITEAQSLEYLKTDMLTAETTVNVLVNPQLNQNQFDAIVDFVFNVGSGNFAKSSVLSGLNAGNFVDAMIGLKRWDEASGVVLAGLILRRSAEIELFNTPVDN